MCPPGLVPPASVFLSGCLGNAWTHTARALPTSVAVARALHPLCLSMPGHPLVGKLSYNGPQQPRFQRGMRGAIRTLEEVGFLDRAVTTGSTHRPTPNGLHRKPVLFMFGSEYDLAIAVAAVLTCQRDEIGGEPLFVLSAPRRFALGRAMLA